MVSEQFNRLLAQLCQISRAKKLGWQATRQLNAYRIGLGEGGVRICDDSGPDYAAGSYIVQLLNRDGRVIEEMTITEHLDERYQAVDELYCQARASAHHLDHLIDTMLGDLESGRTRELPPEDEAEDEVPF
jgi:hypothetical protein